MLRDLMDRNLRDRRIVVAWMVHGAQLERSADETARALTAGLNARDVLLLAALAYDRNGRALPNELIGPVHSTAAGVTGSLRRLHSADLISREVGDDARTRPVSLTTAGSRLIADIVGPWQLWFDDAVDRLNEDDRNELYRLMVKASATWQGAWPDHLVDEVGPPTVAGLDGVRGLLLDIDGVLCRGDDAIPGAADAVHRFRHAGLELVAVTNNTRSRASEHAAKLAAAGIDIGAHQILTAGEATARLLADLDGDASIFVAGSAALRNELLAAGLHESETPDYVVAGIDLDMTLSRLAEAARHLNAGAQLIACNPDRTLPVSSGTAPETGAVVAFLEAASDKTARVVGKPNAQIYETALQMIGLDRSSVMMVGDTPETDIIGANAAGIRSAYIGDDNELPADSLAEPSLCVADLSDLADRLLG